MLVFLECLFGRLWKMCWQRAFAKSVKVCPLFPKEENKKKPNPLQTLSS